MKPIVTSLLLAVGSMMYSPKGYAQSEIYPQHFDLEEVTLLDSPFRTAMLKNDSLLLAYDADRLLTPFIRQAGLSDQSDSKYYNWTTLHPSFSNWGLSDWSLEGHVGGHYLTALSLAYAACDNTSLKEQLKERLDYCLDVLKDCQDAFANNTEGMKGFIGGQPINQIWIGLYSGNLAPFKQYGGWVPFYCQHKVLAGLRDAWIYAGSEIAKELFRGLCDWSVNVISNLTDSQVQEILGWEHGGMNEPFADAYRLFGDAKYLTSAKRYCHQSMVDGMQTLSTTFLDGKHANTQVPKYIGFERIYQEDVSAATLRTAAHNFWQDVAENRTVCIGGNSVSEHFLAANRGSQYIDNLEGPETCNSNNMLKLSEELFDETHDARYADFYEQTTWNHILSTQDPLTGGYVYFTTLRPQGYRIYSQVNQAMWCCVGTGMENHSKYGHFIYTHSTDNQTLYVNLFISSELNSESFKVRQETQFPYEPKTVITVKKTGNYTIAIRQPAWTTTDYAIDVNGTTIYTATTTGTASYHNVTRDWKEGDIITVKLPMQLRYEECPNYSDFIAFKYGPILLAAQTTATSETNAESTGLNYESLQNEYAGEGRMDHSPGSKTSSLSLLSSPLLIGERDTILNSISPTANALNFTLQVPSGYGTGDWGTLSLVPFYTIHHARYCCYFYQQTEENYTNSSMGKADAEAAELQARTLDFVATGEQQSEAGHEASYAVTSSTGSYNGETYRDGKSNDYVQYVLTNSSGRTDSIALMLRLTTADKGRKATIYIDGEKFYDLTVQSTASNADDKGFYNQEMPIPVSLLSNEDGSTKDQITVRIVASSSTLLPGLYYLRLLSGYPAHAYQFVATDWQTGDANRVTADKITYDTVNNTLTVRASGNNNVCLSINTTITSYNVTSELKYLIVKGSGLKVSSGANYLWWLNGTNKGTSIAPVYAQLDDEGDAIIAWQLSSTDLDANCKGDIWSLSAGQTIFGLTSTNGTALIKYIGFVSSVKDYLDAVGIEHITTADKNQRENYYDLSGRCVSHPTQHGIYIVNHKKVVI